MLKITTHRIRITAAAPGTYSTSGAITLKGAFNPLRASALELLAKGANPADKLVGVFEGATISPVALARLARAYVPPRVDHRRADPSFNLDLAA